MGVRTVLVVGAALAATAVGATIGVRRVLRQREVDAAILNETLPVHSKWWREQAKLDGELLYVVIGDSAAQGIGASRPEKGYVGMLAERVRRLTGRTVRVHNLSVSGATVGDAVAVQLPKFEPLEPDVVTVAIGANDIAKWDPVAFEADIRTIYGALPGHAIVADLPCFFLPGNERKVAVANGIVRAVAGELGLTVAPLYEITRRQGLRGILTQFAKDFFHPNDRGYRVWASAFEPALTASVIERFPSPGTRAAL